MGLLRANRSPYLYTSIRSCQKLLKTITHTQTDTKHPPRPLEFQTVELEYIIMNRAIPYCQAPTQLPTPSPLESIQLIQELSWIYAFGLHHHHPTTTILLF